MAEVNGKKEYTKRLDENDNFGADFGEFGYLECITKQIENLGY